MANPTILTLTEADKKKLQVLLDADKNKVQNTINRPRVVQSEDTSTTEVYVIKTPEDGIPAISIETPGSAICDLYKVSLSNGSLTRISGLTKRVYNLSDSAIEGETWKTIKRDKSGTWWVDLSGGTSAPDTFFIRVTDNSSPNYYGYDVYGEDTPGWSDGNITSHPAIDIRDGVIANNGTLAIAHLGDLTIPSVIPMQSSLDDDAFTETWDIVTRDAIDGNYTLTIFDEDAGTSNTTAPLAWNASPSTIASALAATAIVSSVVGGSTFVSLPDTTYTITYTKFDANITRLESDTTNLVGTRTLAIENDARMTVGTVDNLIDLTWDSAPVDERLTDYGQPTLSIMFAITPKCFRNVFSNSQESIYPIVEGAEVEFVSFLDPTVSSILHETGVRGGSAVGPPGVGTKRKLYVAELPRALPMYVANNYFFADSAWFDANIGVSDPDKVIVPSHSLSRDGTTILLTKNLTGSGWPNGRVLLYVDDQPLFSDLFEAADDGDGSKLTRSVDWRYVGPYLVRVYDEDGIGGKGTYLSSYSISGFQNQNMPLSGGAVSSTFIVRYFTKFISQTIIDDFESRIFALENP